MNGSRRTGILLVFAASCAHEVGFDSSYVTHEPPASAASGKLLLMMSPSDRELVYEGAAQSRRGADHRLIVPMGAIIAEIGTTVLGRCFEEGVLTDVREADVGSILGFGFAPFTGGTLSYIDFMGTKTFVALCEALAKKYGRRFAPNALLLDLAAKGETFYGRFAGGGKKVAA